MQQLPDYQNAFYQAIFDNKPPLLEKAIGKIEDFEERFRIYSNNVFSSLKNVLRDDFPVCCRILGEEKFNQAAFNFVRNFPPESGCLLQYGQKFPIFVAAMFPEMPHVKEIAAIEWAKKELYYTDDTCPLDPRALASIPVNQHDLITFGFPNATSFMKSEFSLKALWGGTDEAENDHPVHSRSYSLLIRPRYKIHHFWLKADEYEFYLHLYQGKTLGEAFQQAAEINPHFNLAESLGSAFTNEYFTNAEI